MSMNDQFKERLEEDCLKRACILAKTKRAKTRNILRMMEGASVSRQKNDSPDMIKIASSGSKPVYIGVEHFLVDQATITKAGKTQSSAQQHRQQIMRDYKQGHALYENEEPIPDELVKKLAEDIFRYAAAVNHSGYESLLLAFRTALNKHLSKVSVYRNEVARYANGVPIKMAFLIEIHCYAKTLFLNYGRSVRNNPDALIPMYSDIVKLLEEIDSSMVDYVILYIQKASDKSVANVIALETGNIAGCLRSQGIPIYEYCSDGVNINFRQDTTEQIDADSFCVNYEVIPDHHDNYMKRFIPGLRKAYELRRQGKPFAAPRSIQGLMYAFGNNVSFVTGNDGEVSIKTVLTQEEVIARYDEFARKNVIGEDESEPVG